MEETVTYEPVPMPLPVDLAAYEDGREAMEEAGEIAPALLLPTLADAQRALARVRYFRLRAVEVADVFDAEEERLRAELEQVRRRREEAVAPWKRREQWYLAALEQFAREQHRTDPKVKTVKLPAGDLTLRAQQPEWLYGDEQALGRWLLANAPQYVRPAPAKTDLKKAAKVLTDGSVMLAATGEVIPGIVVQQRPPQFDVKIAL